MQNKRSKRDLDILMRYHGFSFASPVVSLLLPRFARMASPQASSPGYARGFTLERIKKFGKNRPKSRLSWRD